MSASERDLGDSLRLMLAVISLTLAPPSNCRLQNVLLQAKLPQTRFHEGSPMAGEQLLEYLTAAKTVLDIFKGIKGELPAGPKKEETERQIDRAEVALKSAEAELAKALGFRLCRCTFPPEPMLWNRDRRVSVCPKCGDVYPPPPETRQIASAESSWIKARRG